MYPKNASVSRTCFSNSRVVGSLPNCSPVSYSPKYSRSLLTCWPIMAAGTHVPCNQIEWSSPCIDGVDAVDPVDATPACLTLHKHFEMHRTREMTERWRHTHLP